MAEINNEVTKGNEGLGLVLDGIKNDLTNLLATHNTLIAKLNSDAGITDTDYAAGTTLETTKA